MRLQILNWALKNGVESQPSPSRRLEHLLASIIEPVAVFRLCVLVAGSGFAARVTLLDTLRNTLQVFDTRKGYDFGQCGVCTVHINGRAGPQHMRNGYGEVRDWALLSMLINTRSAVRPGALWLVTAYP
jgi:hypothetical protein